MAGKYWVVGATEDQGVGENHAEEWSQKGVWKLMWEEGEKPRYDALFKKMLPGDRIAIKSMMGQGKSTIKIRAIGIVKEVSLEGRMVVVDWMLTNMKRIVQSRGCYGTLHGPFQKDMWSRRVFSL